MKIMRKLAPIFATLALSASAFAANPKPFRVDFGPEGVIVRDLQPGTNVAWMGMIRESLRYHTRVKIVSGYGPMTADSSLDLTAADAGTTRAMWVVADADSGVGLQANSPAMLASNRAIAMRAAVGSTTIEIDSTAVEVLYVRPGAGAWRFAVADGGGLDADGLTNGSIAMRLSDLKPLETSPAAPATTRQGDLLLVIDPRGFRSASMGVGQ